MVHIIDKPKYIKKNKISKCKNYKDKKSAFKMSKSVKRIYI